jgi:hypothetical protein
MDWRCSSSGRAPALQVQSPEFKSQSHQEKRKGKERKRGKYLLHRVEQKLHKSTYAKWKA